MVIKPAPAIDKSSPQRDNKDVEHVYHRYMDSPELSNGVNVNNVGIGAQESLGRLTNSVYKLSLERF